MEDARVEPGPACFRGRPITLRFEGRRVRCFEGDTLGAALHAAGERVLMRSIKYHRPRGLFCNAGKCANCLVRVDGVPNVRACVTQARDGMVVQTQNAWPTARRDLLGVVDGAYPVVFDPHTRFIRPKVFTPVYQAVIRRMAGFGKLPDLRPAPARRPRIEPRDVDVLVVGAGPAGLSAALAAAQAGARVLCVDESDRAGGSLLLVQDAGDGRHGAHHADELARRVGETGGEIVTRAVAFGIYLTDGAAELLPPPGVVPVLTPERILETRPRALVVATGFHETPPLFAGNDLPGVMGARAALVLLHRHGVLPGRRAVLTSPHGLAPRAREALAKAGVEIAGVAGEGEWRDARLVEARGEPQVRSVVLENGGRRWEVEADLVLACGDESPRVEILQQAGARLAWRGGVLGPAHEGVETGVPGVFAAGSLVAREPLAARLEQGRIAGEAAARHARGGGD